jgi:hypothetical protein
MRGEHLTTYVTLAVIALLLVWKALQRVVDVAGGPEWGGFALSCALAALVAAHFLRRRLGRRLRLSWRARHAESASRH